MLRKTQRIVNQAGEDIMADIRHREDAREVPVVILVHGFKGFKDWGFFPDLAERLAMDGYVTITFNFSRNGIGYDPRTFERLDLFSENTHSHELDDLQSVIDEVRAEKIARRYADPERIALLGHSRGGGTALLKAAELGDVISCVITWASVASFFRYSEAQIAQWEKEGVIEIENSRTGQMMPIKKSLWDDLNSNKDKLDILKACANLENPALFIHGSEDATVAPSCSEQLHEACSSYVKRLEVIEGAGHTFNVKHPMERDKPPREYITACDITENWFDNYLNI
ncbi:MAG: alpha/beta fold hydrolase [Calditrichaeota bacterium]|nr:MAG: alpha/beta fold hydrolase [Calditrichota bacterium]